MSSIFVTSIFGVIVGVICSVFFAKKSTGKKDSWYVFGALILAGVGAAIAFFVGGAAYMFCNEVLKVCANSNEQTVWLFTLPIVAYPLYFFVLLMTKPVHKSNEL